MKEKSYVIVFSFPFLFLFCNLISNVDSDDGYSDDSCVGYSAR